MPKHRSLRHWESLVGYSFLPPSMNTILHVWQRLLGVTRLHIEANSLKGAAGWNGAGTGEIDIEQSGSTIVYREKGTWETAEGRVLPFKNRFRWTYDAEQSVIGLEHLRFGERHPVFLFNLSEKTQTQLVSVSPHLCAADCYEGKLDLPAKGFHLQWTIKGPNKDELIQYKYF